jgi:hypothetical protein
MAEYVNAVGYPKEHEITMSTFKIGHFDTLARTMAHEMIHMAQQIAGTRSRSMHNADFMRRIRLVAKHHGWDMKEL